MKIGLFIPCYMNELYPDVCFDTLKILEALGYDVTYPLTQTCCGQPMANSGCATDVAFLAHRFVEIFKVYDYVVAPSASCVAMVREHYESFFQEDDKDFYKVRDSTFEITEFLHDIVKIDSLNISFPFRVGVHNSCHGQRMLRLGSASELQIPHYSKLKNILNLIDDIKIVQLQRDDECCGFGGTFSVVEPEISVAMGNSRILDHLEADAQIITGADMSCLMHMQGLIDKNKQPIKVMHIVQILSKGFA